MEKYYCSECNKEVYSTKSEAATAAKGIWDDNKVKMNPYKCPVASYYHLSTARTGKRLRDIPHRLNDLSDKPLKKKKNGI